MNSPMITMLRLVTNDHPHSTTSGKAQGTPMDWNSLEQRLADDATGWIILGSKNPAYASIANERAVRADPSLMNPVRTN